MDWLSLARELHMLGQAGLTFTENGFDRERYEKIIALSAKILSEKHDLDAPAILEKLKFEKGYLTPKIVVRGALFLNNRILLVKETTDKRWAMPGGYADIGESLKTSVERELLEETGLEVKATGVIGIYNHLPAHGPQEYWHNQQVLYYCEKIGGSLQTSFETEEVASFEINELPELSTNRTKRQHIQDALDFHLDPQIKTKFD